MWIKSLPMRVELRYEERRGCFSGGGGTIQKFRMLEGVDRGGGGGQL